MHTPVGTHAHTREGGGEGRRKAKIMVSLADKEAL